MSQTSQENSISEREYRNEIESLADEVVRTLEEYPEDYEDFSEIVWETVDSHKWIMYFSYNTDVLNHAENEPDDWKSLVGDDASWREVIQVMAYRAMELDLYFEVQGRLDD